MAAPKPPSRYDVPSGPETEFQPGSHRRVLRNLVGIRTKREADQAEYDALLAAQRLYVRERITPDTRFTTRLLRDMHKDWLGGLYAWAGNYRTVNLAKAGFLWPPAYLVPSHMETFEKTLLKEYTPCRGNSVREIASSLAQVHGELLLIHPFRDGNGRLARWLADLMVLQCGLTAPDYRFRGRGSPARRAAYLTAVQKAYDQNYDLLTDFFEAALAVKRLVPLRGGDE